MDRRVIFVAWIAEGHQAKVVKLFIEVNIDGKGGRRPIPAGVAASVGLRWGERKKVREHAKRGAR